MNRTILALLVATLPPAAAAAQGQVGTTATLTHAGARTVMDAALAAAKRLRASGAFAIVDAGGNPLLLERLDGTFPASASVALGKARTSALFQKPTKAFEDVIQNGRAAMLAAAEVTAFTPLQGGVPIVWNGEVAGAIGVSGAASAQQDEELALAGVAALAPRTAAATGAAAPCCDVAFFARAQVDDAFARGAPLLETATFKIHASRRDQPGLAEVHADETDVIYVTGGSATFVTGGKVVAGQNVSAHEVRGPSIDGGETRVLQPGDVIVVPKGVAHWFQEVRAPFTYYVVKVIG